MTAPPGRILAEVLAAEGLSQAGFARRTGLSAKHVNQIVGGYATLTHRTATILERQTGVSAHVWMLLESAHRIPAEMPVELAAALRGYLDDCYEENGMP